MKLTQLMLIPVATAMLAMACAGKAESNGNQTKQETTMTKQTPDTADVRIGVKTTLGSFTVLLYGDTPKHRDNFVKLVNEGYYDSTLFHRVIKDFMVQAGDPDSKTAKPGQHLGAGGPDYKIDAEIVYPRHFHKRGALAAARQGDQVNPMKKSSGSQFYIVTGTKIAPNQIAGLEARMKNSAMQNVFNNLAMQHRDEIIDMQKRGDRAGLQALQDSLIAETEKTVAGMETPTLTPEMRQAYTTVGGAPHLDGEYTVFGEVIDGMETIDRIEKAQTDSSDRPKEDIRILSMHVIEDK
ncbi:MAG: peptidylprolyl isomerase [Muribaculaceae bacterium]|nr:peptidylprolyl isomerase [Muribaculaceae bacterium]